jgi:hypothetical protein
LQADKLYRYLVNPKVNEGTAPGILFRSTQEKESGHNNIEGEGQAKGKNDAVADLEVSKPTAS